MGLYVVRFGISLQKENQKNMLAAKCFSDRHGDMHIIAIAKKTILAIMTNLCGIFVNKDGGIRKIFCLHQKNILIYCCSGG